MALPSVAPYAQVQSGYFSGCIHTFAGMLNNSSNYAPESYTQNSLLLNFADILPTNNCRLYSTDMPGVSLRAVRCGEMNYNWENHRTIKRSTPLTDFEFAELKLECEMACQGITSEDGLMRYLTKLYAKLQKAIIMSVDELLLKAIAAPVTIENCGADSTITIEEDGVPTVNATGTGGLTDAVMSEVLTALSENNALSNSASDVLLILPQRAVNEWRASIPGNSLDFNDYRSGSIVNTIRGMNVYTPMNQRSVFQPATVTIGGSSVTGIAAYAVVRGALCFGSASHLPMANDRSAHIVPMDTGMGIAALGANVFDVKRGIHFAYDLRAGALRQAPWGIVRILLPSNLFTS